jgi:chromosomal replication initiator protein
MLINKPLKIIEIICDYQDVKINELKSRSRRRDITYARHLIMYFMRKRCYLTFTEIGRFFGLKDHTTIMYGVQRIEGLVEMDESAKEEVSRLKQKIDAEFLKLAKDEININPYVFAGIRF